MTQEEFIEVLDKKGYSYEMEGNKIVVTYKFYVDLVSLTSLPPGVVFSNVGEVGLRSLEAIPPDVEFRTTYDVNLQSLTGNWFSEWEGNIKGIRFNRLLNKMISIGIFNRRR